MEYLETIPHWFAADLRSIGITTTTWFGCYDREPMRGHVRAALDNWLLHILIEGEEELNIQGHTIGLLPRQGTIVPPGSAFTQKIIKSSTFLNIPILFHGPPTYERNPLFSLNLPRALSVFSSEALRLVLKEIKNMKSPSGSRSPWDCFRGARLAQELVLNLLAGGFREGVLPQERPCEIQWVVTCRDLLIKNYRNPEYTIGDVAKEVGKSLGLVQRVFASTFDHPPKEWLHRYRLSIATNLMQNNPHFTVEAIMKRCGYRNRSLMHRMFKRYLGCTPGEMRRKSAEGSGSQLNSGRENFLINK